MSRANEKMVNQLKSRFYDFLQWENNEQHLQKMLPQWVKCIANALNAIQAALYRTDGGDWNRLYLSSCLKNNQNLPNQLTRIEIEKYVHHHSVYISKNPLMDPLSPFNTVLQFRVEEGEYWYLFLYLSKEWMTEDHHSQLLAIQSLCETFIKNVVKMERVMDEERQFKELYQFTEKIHSTMDILFVLKEIIGTLKRVFPNYSFTLMLTNDHESLEELPVEYLEFDSDDDVALQAYVEGKVLIADSYHQVATNLYAPLKGNQGVYGVLKVSAPYSIIFPKTQLEFIRLLVNTAGSALENAKLYEQSKRLIADLQLINETSHKLNSNLRLLDTIQFLHQQITDSFHSSATGFVFCFDDHNKVIPGSSPFFEEEVGKWYISYVRKQFDREREALLIGDLLGKLDSEVPFRSLMAVPMRHSEELIGLCITLHEKPYHFTFEMFKLLQSLIHHSTLALSNSMLREELEKMVITDHLTKLYSRNYLDESVIKSMMEDEQGTFIVIDIDNFKQVNDTYGHQVGDKIIIQVANIIKNNIRASDIGARWGGEELAVYLPNVSYIIGYTIAQRLVEKVRMETKPRVTISCGVSYWNKSKKDSLERLFHRADMALYEAKNRGKNQAILQKDI
jgi:diguanylate cyclase (GGDEF)-like protein